MRIGRFTGRGAAAVALALVCGAALAGVSCRSTPERAASHPWLELETAHFIVRSEVGEQRTIAVATRLEQFRAVAHSLTGIPENGMATRARVYVFADARSFDPYRNHLSRVAGYFVAQPQGPYITLIGGDAGDERVVYHEFVHLLMDHPRIDVPTWYEEGFAEILSTFRIRGGRAQVGRPVRERLEELRFFAWPANPEVLSVSPESKAYREMEPTFHSQAWALVHYFMFGDSDHLSQLDDYLARWRRGEDPEQAFSASFGVGYDVMWQRVAAHMRDARLPFGDFPAPKAVVGPSTPSRRLSSAEARSALGELLLAWGAGGALRAAPLFEQALVDDPQLALPKAGIARVYDLAMRYDEAGALLDEALRESPQNLQILVMRGDHLVRAAIVAEGPARTQGLADARAAYGAAAALNPASSEIVLRMGLTYLYESEPADEGLAFLDSAVRNLPHSRALAEASARLQLQHDRRDEARSVLARTSHASVSSPEVETWLDAIEASPAASQPFDGLVVRIGRRPGHGAPSSAR